MRKMNTKDRAVKIAETRAAVTAEFAIFLENPGSSGYSNLEYRMKAYQEYVCNIDDDDTMLRGDPL